MDNTTLSKLLIPYCVSAKTVIRHEAPVTYTKDIAELRFSLMTVGFIMSQNAKNNIFTLKICSGIFNLTYAYFALELKNGVLNISGCANEGIIRQNIYEKALKKLMGVISDE